MSPMLIIAIERQRKRQEPFVVSKHSSNSTAAIATVKMENE